MEIILLFISTICWLLPVDLIHLTALIIHYLVGVTMWWILIRKQPLSAMFIAIYTLMNFTNPIGILLGLIPLETFTPLPIFYKCNTLLMVGFDLFIFGAIRLRFKRFNIDSMVPISLPYKRTNFSIFLILTISGLSLAALVVAGQKIGANVFEEHKTFRSGGNLNAFFLFVGYFTMLLPMGVFLISLKPIRKQLPYLSFVILLLTLHFMTIRVRTLPVSCILAWGFGMIAKYYIIAVQERPKASTRTGARLKTAVAIGMPLLVATGISIRYARTSYQMGDWHLDSERIQITLESTFTGGDLGYAYMTRLAMDVFPNRADYQKGQSYYRLLFVPIPRQLWPSKPESINHVFAEHLNARKATKGLSAPPGIIGTLYANFGNFGVVGMLLFGWMFSLERYRGLTGLLILSATGIWLFKFIRGEPSDPTVFLLIICIYSLIFTRIISFQYDWYRHFDQTHKTYIS